MLRLYEGKGSEMCEERKTSDNIFVLERHDFIILRKRPK